jgi:Domain of unknown function (DUF4779)
LDVQVYQKKNMSQNFILIFLACIVIKDVIAYANDFPYQKYGYNVEKSAGDADGARYLKNKLRDQDGRLKSQQDSGASYLLDSAKNDHDLKHVKKGTSTDKLTHVQGEDFENDKTHKRKHVKSGFQNSYHKDENGSRSSYYEDSDDTGGKVVYDKRHGQRGDNQEQQFAEGLRNGISKDRYDDRRNGYENRDLQDQQRYHVEDHGKTFWCNKCFTKQQK